jgi:hypothetical protein
MNTDPQLLTSDAATDDSAAVNALKAKYYRLLREEMLFNQKHRNLAKPKRFPQQAELDDLQAYIRELAITEALTEKPQLLTES